jgi:hypothetical protein
MAAEVSNIPFVLAYHSDTISGNEVRYCCYDNDSTSLPKHALQEANAFHGPLVVEVKSRPRSLRFVSLQVLSKDHRLASGHHESPVQPRWKAIVTLGPDSSLASMSDLKVMRKSGTNRDCFCNGPFDERDWQYLGPFLAFIGRTVYHTFRESGLMASHGLCYSNFFLYNTDVATRHLKAAHWRLETHSESQAWVGSGPEWVKHLQPDPK